MHHPPNQLGSVKKNLAKMLMSVISYIALSSVGVGLSIPNNAYAHLSTEPVNIVTLIDHDCGTGTGAEGCPTNVITVPGLMSITELENYLKTLHGPFYTSDERACKQGVLLNSNTFIANPNAKYGEITILHICESGPHRTYESHLVKITRNVECAPNHFPDPNATTCDYFTTAPTASFKVTMGDLSNYINNIAPFSTSKADDIIALMLRDALAQSDISLKNGSLILDTVLDDKNNQNENYNGWPFCITTKVGVDLTGQTLKATTSSDSSLLISSNNITKELRADAALNFKAEYRGKIKISWHSVDPKPFSTSCLSNSVSAPFYAYTQADGTIGAKVDFNFSFHKETRIATVNPEVSLSGSVDNMPQLIVVPDFGAISSLIATGPILTWLENDIIAKEVSNRLNSFLLAKVVNPKLTDQLNLNAARMTQTLSDKLGDLKYFTVPSLSPEVLSLLKLLVQAYSLIPLTDEYLSLYYDDILFNLLIGDKKALYELLGSAVACGVGAELTKLAPTTLPPIPVYTFSPLTGACVAADPTTTTLGNYYTDTACSQPADFAPSSFVEFCADYSDVSRFGNPASWNKNKTLTELPWTLSPETQFALSTNSIQGNHQPYMKKAHYRTVPVTIPINGVPTNTECELEMRIYKKDLKATNLTPIIDIHGGSFSSRRLYIGTAVQMSHLTERNYIVFSPFYRLVGTEDGNAECNQSNWDGFMSDTKAALEWVLQHGPEYGAKPVSKIAVSGLSAGAAMAGWLATNDSTRNSVSRAFLRYPPTDLEYLVQPYQGLSSDADILLCNEAAAIPGQCLEPFTYGAVRGVVGTELHLVDLNSPLIIDATYTKKIAQAPDQFPPIFMIHGRLDHTVPSSQSSLLCNALSGVDPTDFNIGPADNTFLPNEIGTLHKAYTCDNRGSELHLIENGDHVVDICNVGVPCLPGNAASKKVVADIMAKGWNWLDPKPVVTPPPVVSPPATPPTPPPLVNGVDLTMTLVSAPNTALPGDTITVSGTVTNFGNVAVASNNAPQAKFFLSRDQVYAAVVGENDIPISGALWVTPLAPGASQVISFTYKIPTNLALSGAYYIVGIVDLANQVVEADDPVNPGDPNNLLVGNNTNASNMMTIQ